jgi:uncharacterized membrane protein
MMTLIASAFPLAGWLLYSLVAGWLEVSRPSLSSLMNVHRRRWVANAARRETPLDAILAGNLMSSVSFLASTTVLLILALFAVFGQLGAVADAVSSLQPQLGQIDLEIHLLLVLAMFVLAFLSFTLSLRQFNHFCILVGAMSHDPAKVLEDDIATIAQVNSLAARNFNTGIRAYYFAIAALVWFVWVPGAILVTVAIAVFLIQREFYSTVRRLIAQLAKD